MMKKLSMSLAVVLCMLTLFSTVSGQLLVENFDFPAGENLTDHGWDVLESGGENPVTVSSEGLSYTDYISSGIGNAALLDNTGEDVVRSFTAQTSGDIYVSFLVNADDVGDNVSFNEVLILSSATGAGARWGRFWVDKNSTSLRFGVSQFTESATYTDATYSFGTTYLIVLKYSIVSGSDNDQTSLFVFEYPTLPATEPVTPTLGPTASYNTDPSDIARIVLRQVTALNNLRIDGIRIDSSWNDAPLPVELSSFTYSIDGGDVKLGWTTASETNNFGFDIERSIDAKWEKVGFVEGCGTTSAPQYYEFIDHHMANRTCYYRLRQIDTDGTFSYSSTLCVAPDIPDKIQLAQCYPNPFNASTKISYVLSEANFVSLKIYDMRGKEVAKLYEGLQAADSYSVQFDASAYSSGVYFYKLQAGNDIVKTQKMLLLK
ncbi:T9SS type A sorting domain-containing protein [candidate division KSB1 bacterium]|nr:T9SS type A sorting domain-containing protein [candidate division KSB1 bacterium]